MDEDRDIIKNLKEQDHEEILEEEQQIIKNCDYVKDFMTTLKESNMHQMSEKS